MVPLPVEPTVTHAEPNVASSGARLPEPRQPLVPSVTPGSRKQRSAPLAPGMSVTRLLTLAVPHMTILRDPKTQSSPISIKSCSTTSMPEPGQKIRLPHLVPSSLSQKVTPPQWFPLSRNTAHARRRRL